MNKKRRYVCHAKGSYKQEYGKTQETLSKRLVLKILKFVVI